MKPSKNPGRLTLAGVGLLLGLLALLLQWRDGAYGSEFGGHPDEAAHFITGLMVRDYLLHGIPGNPMRFAEEYYDHYPKVALGHYPPGFYALEGAWLSVFPVAKGSALVLMALLAGAFGTLAFAWAREQLPATHAAAIGILTVALPLTRTMTSTIMADLALAIACLLAARSFARFLEVPGWRPSLLFGLWAAVAAMVKGSGLFLALLPPLAILIAWKPGVLRRPSLWTAVVPVALIVGPWMLYSRHITAEGMIDRTPLEHLRLALPYFASQFARNFGFSVPILAVAGIVRLAARKGNADARLPFWAVHLSLPIALVAFFSLIPAGLEPRYLLPAIPSILCLAGAGLTWFSGRGQAVAAAAALALLILHPFLSSPPAKAFGGFAFAADSVLAGTAGKYLIASDARGEGAFIVEVALRDADRPSTMVKRGSKILATSDWLGRDYETVFDDEEELAGFLNETDLAGIVVDEGVPEIFRRSYHDLLARVLASGGTPFKEVAAHPALRPGTSGAPSIRVYQRPPSLMLFNSYTFWLFFAVVVLIYRRLPHRAQNRFLLVASYVFYGYWDWRFLSLLLLSTAVDYFVALELTRRKRRGPLLVSLVFNLGLLGLFKYAGFFVHEAVALCQRLGLDIPEPVLGIVLPVGISFYTFQTLSYTVDVYRGHTPAARNFADFALYVSFFPQLVAGPIERSTSLMPQILQPRVFGGHAFRDGLYHVLYGLFKKIVIADNMAGIANYAFGLPPAERDGLTVLLGVYAFAFQIYGDFSAYSSIAQGVAKWLGFDLMTNFHHPYFATSPQKFWQRWHISLSTWLRDYLYIPLGGNRHGAWKTYRNLLLTMLLGGFWHGANWTFLIWGLIHGLWLAAHRYLCERKRPESGRVDSLPLRALKLLVTFHLVCLTWLFFRAESLGQAMEMLGALGGKWQLTPFAQYALGMLAFFLVPLFAYEAWVERRRNLLALTECAWPLRAAIYVYVILMLLYFPAPGVNEFIYFQF